MVDSTLLREERFFADLTDAELDALSKITKQQKFEVGETIFKESEKGESFYIIRSGEVKACVTAPNGESFTLAMLKDGDIFGAMSFVGGRPRSATIIAASEVERLVIGKSDFASIIDENPSLIHKILSKIIFNAHSIVRAMNARYLEMINYMWGRKRFT